MKSYLTLCQSFALAKITLKMRLLVSGCFLERFLTELEPVKHCDQGHILTKERCKVLMNPSGRM